MSLLDDYPELCKEWDYSKNENGPDYYSGNNGYYAHWICSKCKSNYCAIINNRTSKNSNCPYCSRNKINNINCLATTHPELCEEWLYDRNTITPEQISSGSNKKVWWKCSKCNKELFVSPKDKIRAKNSNYCKHAKFVRKRNGKVKIFLLDKCPFLINEWDPENDRSVHEMSYGSDYVAKWVCKKCNSKWKQKVRKRSESVGCPYCAGKKVNETNSLLSKYPNLEKEFDYNKNNFTLEQVTAKSALIANWICFKCKSEYSSSISSKTSSIKKLGDYSGCPYCTGKKVNETNSLLKINPKLSLEWSNLNKLSISEITCGSRSKVWWICSDCNFEWQATVNLRNRGSGCPRCSLKISKVEIEWLNSLNVVNRQVRINIGDRYFKVDGYDPMTNTVYEFYGDYWHGNPNIYNRDDINNSCHKSFGQLYDELIEKENMLVNAGFNIVSIWESDWRIKNNQYIKLHA